MMKAKYIMAGFFFFLFGCKETTFEKNNFIGIWKSDDGASIVFNQDGTCILNGVDNSVISIAKNEKEKLDSKGTWEIINLPNSGITVGGNTGIKISYNLMGRDGKGGILFYISGQGMSENKPPWNLFVWKGDPDEMIKYKFVKQ